MDNKPKTNADRIREMTDEEMAEFLPGKKFGYNCPPEHEGCLGECVPCWIDWLKQEHKCFNCQIKVGDEIEFNNGGHDGIFNRGKGIVYRVIEKDDDVRTDRYYALTKHGVVILYEDGGNDIRKTGRTFPQMVEIVEALDDEQC